MAHHSSCVIYDLARGGTFNLPKSTPLTEDAQQSTRRACAAERFRADPARGAGRRLSVFGGRARQLASGGKRARGVGALVEHDGLGVTRAQKPARVSCVKSLRFQGNNDVTTHERSPRSKQSKQG